MNASISVIYSTVENAEVIAKVDVPPGGISAILSLGAERTVVEVVVI
jgi:hypothetical protein